MRIDVTDDNEGFADGDEEVNWDQVEELQIMMVKIKPDDEAPLDFYDKLAGHG